MSVMSLAEIMDRSIEILRRYIKTIIMYVLGYGIISFVLIFVGMFLILLIFMPMSYSMMWSLSSTSWISPMVIVSFIGLYCFSIYTSFNIGIIKISSQEFLGEKVYAHHAIKTSFKSIFRVSGIVLIATLLFIPIAGGFGAIVYFFYNSSLFMWGEIETVVTFAVIGLVAILLISAYYTLYSFSLHAVAVEDKGVFDSIKRSLKLVKNDYWKIFGCILLFHFTVYAIRMSFESVLAILAGIGYLGMKFFNIHQDFIVYITEIVSIFRWPMNILSWLVITPISTIMISLVYFNQRFKKEGFDMILNLKELQKNSERKQFSEMGE